VETSAHIAPLQQRNGIGELLYRQLHVQLRTNGFHCARGCITQPSDASGALHGKLGLRIVGELEEVG
jgi:L-amino acid N-acyltransferase YncA